MAGRLMTSAELDAHERRWTWLLFIFAATLMVDLACLYTIEHASLARFVCWLLAVASGLASALALRRLHSIGNLEAISAQRWEADAGDVADVVDSLTDLCNTD
jgi:hypothetical protein